MAQMNVAQFASELKMPATALLEQLAKAGVSKEATNDVLSEQDKARLLDYLRKAHGETAHKAKITLTRKQTTEIKSADSTGKARTIQVEVRKKRTFVKRDAEMPTEVVAPEPVAIPEPVVSSPIIDEKQSALRESEAKRQAELAALQAAEVKEKQEREARAKAEAEARLAQQQAEMAKKTAEQAKTDAATVSGTLHKPAAKPGEEVKKPGAKKAPGGNWKDDAAAKKRGIKTRGDAAGGAGGWRGGPRGGRHGGRHH